MNLSLISGWLPWAVVAVAASVTVASLVGHWRRATLAIVTWWGLAAGVYVATGGRIMGTDLPMSVFLSGAVPVVGLVAATTVVSRRQGWWRRATAVAAVPLVLMAGLVWLDRWFAYYPTLGSLLASAPPVYPGSVGVGSRLAVGSRLPGPDAVMPSHGSLFTVDYAASRSHFHHRRGLVWLPPAWFTSARPTLGVVMLLAGVPGDPRSWLHGTRVIKTAERYAAAHSGVAPVLVFPDSNGSWEGDTECVDGPRGQAETYLTYDVPRDVARLFGVTRDPRQWAVGGLSGGGTCALVLTLRHPSVLHTFVDLSGELRPEVGSESTTIRSLYGGSRSDWVAHDPGSLLYHHHFSGLAGVFAAGTRDQGSVIASNLLTPLADQAGVSIRLDLHHRGNHNYHFFDTAIDRWFAWLAGRVDPPRSIWLDPSSGSLAHSSGSHLALQHPKLPRPVR